MSYSTRSGSGYGNDRKGSRFFRSGKKQGLADNIAAEKRKLENEIANGEVGDMSYVHGRIDALTWVEGKIPLGSIQQSKPLIKDPVRVQCPRDNAVFEPVIGKSYDGTGKGIWCPNCGATFTFEPETNEWSTSDGSLKVLE